MIHFECTQNIQHTFIKNYIFGHILHIKEALEKHLKMIKEKLCYNLMIKNIILCENC